MTQEFTATCLISRQVAFIEHKYATCELRGSENPQVPGVCRNRSIHHHHHQIRIAHSTMRSLNSQAFDPVCRISQTGGVTKQDWYSLYIHRLAQCIPRSTWYIADYGPLARQYLIEET